MNKIKKFIDNSNISRFRFVFQILAFIFLIYGGYLSLYIGQNIPTFSCPYNPASPGTCYLISAQHQLHASFASLFSFRGIAFVTGLFGFVLLFIVFNKAWCGYTCPLGTIQDWIVFRQLY